jgi:hypothetical protein
MIVKHYTTSYREAKCHVPDHPNRTARRGRSCDVLWQVWESQESMIDDISKEQRACRSLGTDGINRFRWYPCECTGEETI